MEGGREGLAVQKVGGEGWNGAWERRAGRVRGRGGMVGCVGDL